MHEDTDEIEVVPDNAARPAGEETGAKAATLTPAQKAAATRKAQRAAQELTHKRAAEVARLQAEVDRLTKRRRLWQTKEEAARSQLRKVLSQWVNELDPAQEDVQL